MLHYLAWRVELISERFSFYIACGDDDLTKTKKRPEYILTCLDICAGDICAGLYQKIQKIKKYNLNTRNSEIKTRLRPRLIRLTTRSYNFTSRQRKCRSTYFNIQYMYCTYFCLQQEANKPRSTWIKCVLRFESAMISAGPCSANSSAPLFWSSSSAVWSPNRSVSHLFS